MLQKHREEMKKMYQKKVKEQIGYFQGLFQSHHESHLIPSFRHIYRGMKVMNKNVASLHDVIDTLIYWVQRAMTDYLPEDEREYEARSEEADRSSRERIVASNAEVH